MDAVEEIKSRLSIEDVIGEYVELKRSGRNFKGLSPFTNEKTPSFMVSPEKQIWHDFSSGKGGNVFSFVMEVEGLDFKAALEHLARKAGVDLSQYRTGLSAQTGQLKESLYHVVELATKFYQVQFSKHQKVLEYVFKTRQINKETALSFRLGYAPNTGFALVDYLSKKGISTSEMQQAGLSSSRGKRPSDMFRSRLMIPLMDAQGRVIGFTARLLDSVEPASGPKYINTPQTLLYDKSRHVFGLHLAKEAIRRQRYVVVAEGNLDVISSHQAGVAQTVATAGTAMTEMQFKILSRFTGDVRLAFDQDAAGQAATERAIPLASKTGVSLSMVVIPDGKDPDELIKKDQALWEEVIAKPVYALDWLIGRYKQQLDLSSATGKRQFTDVVLQVIAKLPDAVEQDHYVHKIAELLNISYEALNSKFKTEARTSSVKKKVKNVPGLADDVVIKRKKAQDHLLAICLENPTLRSYLKAIASEMLVDDSGRQLLGWLKADSTLTAADLAKTSQVQGLQDYVKMLGLQYEAMYQDLADLELEYEAARLHVRLIELYVKNEKAVLTAKIREADTKNTASLLQKANELDNLLRQTKEMA